MTASLTDSPLTDVVCPAIDLDDYVGPAGAEDVQRLREAAEPLRGKRLLQINSTAYGGGVAELLRTHIGMLRDLGIDANWQVLRGNDEFFTITKKAHNAMQGAPVWWNEEMGLGYLATVREAVADWQDDYDIVMVHDPQPCALPSLLDEQARSRSTWIWRCHIDTSTPDPDVWNFFLPYIDRYDGAVFTMDQYVHPGIEGPKIATIPPTIDPLSTKNVPLGQPIIDAVLRNYGIDGDRPLITQVSRFDPWKDPLGVIDAFRIVQEAHPDAQLLMAGSLADDDPEGLAYLQATQEWAGDDPNIHLLTNLDGVGPIEINAFQRASTVVVQKSTREGFGLVVAEAMLKERPVVGGNAGGITLQIEDGVSGFIVDSPEECGARINELLADADLRERFGKAGKQRVQERFLTVHELEAYLRLMATLVR